MKRSLILISLFLLAGIMLFASSSLENLVPTLTEEQLTTIRIGDFITSSSYEGDVKSLLPQNSAILPEIEEALAYPKGFTLTVCALIPYPEDWKALNDEERMLAMLNKAMETTSMDGMTYHPKLNEAKTKVLFTNSSLLGSPDKKDRIPNAHFDTLPSYLEYYVLQKDETYGDNIYHGIYHITTEELAISLTNASALKMVGIPVVAVGKISIGMDIFQTDEGIYVCGFASLKDKDPVFNILGIKIDVAESVMTRVIALKDWYEGQLSK